MLKLTRPRIAGIIVIFMVAITINAVWRVRVLGEQEKARQQAAEAGVDAGTD